MLNQTHEKAPQIVWNYKPQKEMISATYNQHRFVSTNQLEKGRQPNEKKEQTSWISTSQKMKSKQWMRICQDAQVH